MSLKNRPGHGCLTLWHFLWVKPLHFLISLVSRREYFAVSDSRKRRSFETPHTREDTFFRSPSSPKIHPVQLTGLICLFRCGSLSSIRCLKNKYQEKQKSGFILVVNALHSCSRALLRCCADHLPARLQTVELKVFVLEEDGRQGIPKVQRKNAFKC